MSLMQKLKELIQLSDLCNFQLLIRRVDKYASSTEGNISHQKLRNCWVAKKIMSPTSPVKFRVLNFSETIRCIQLKFSEKTKAVMLFQYSEFLFYLGHQIVMSVC